MERKVGEVFKYRKVYLETQKGINGCDGCLFIFNTKGCCSMGRCTPYSRKDKTDVIFKRIPIYKIFWRVLVTFWKDVSKDAGEMRAEIRYGFTDKLTKEIENDRT